MLISKRYSFLIIFAVIMMFSLAGCYGGGKDNSSKANLETGQGDNEDQMENVLYLAAKNEIPTLRTNGQTDALSATIMQNIFEGLYRKGKDGDPTEGIAEGYETSEDGKVYTFNLRKDVVWSNGDPVTAGDFEYAWKKALHPDTFSPHANLMKPIKNASKIQDPDDEMYGKVEEVGLNVIDDHTLEVTLEDDVPYFLEML